MMGTYRRKTIDVSNNWKTERDGSAKFNNILKRNRLFATNNATYYTKKYGWAVETYANILVQLWILKTNAATWRFVYFKCKQSASTQTRTSPNTFAEWFGLASPDLGAFLSLMQGWVEERQSPCFTLIWLTSGDYFDWTLLENCVSTVDQLHACTIIKFWSDFKLAFSLIQQSRVKAFHG